MEYGHAGISITILVKHPLGQTKYAWLNLCNTMTSIEWVSNLKGYIHKIDDTVTGAETQAIKFDLFSWR